MKKKIIILAVLIVGLLIGFVTGKSGTSIKSDSYVGTYSEKTIQDEAGPFQMSLDEATYQYYDPSTKANGTGKYSVVDTGVIVLTSGDLQGAIAISEKQFMEDNTLSLYHLDNQKNIVLVKSTDSVSDLNNE